MKFNIKKTGSNIVTIGRKIGYIPQKTTNWDETAFTRSIQRDFPRFHLYVKESPTDFILNLHLDQKKPTYGDNTAHSGEYDGELVESEAERIRKILSEEKTSHAEPIQKEEPKKSIASLFKKIFK